MSNLLEFLDDIVESTAISPSQLSGEVKKLNINTVDNLPILSINIRGLKSNFNLLLLFIQSLKIRISIIALCETWLSENDESLFSIPGYTRYNINRSTRGGGLMMFVSDNVISDIVTNMTLINDIFESLCVKLIIKNNAHYVDLIYRIRSSSLDLFVDEIDRVILQSIPLMDVFVATWILTCWGLQPMQGLISP